MTVISSILPASKAFDLEAEKLVLAMHIKRLNRSGEKIGLQTDFSLADQVLLHALIASGVEFDLVAKEEAPLKTSSLPEITMERYGLSYLDAVEKTDQVWFSSDITGATDHPILHWPVEGLVQYVLDHEVPVNPEDMPGFIKAAA